MDQVSVRSARGIIGACMLVIASASVMLAGFQYVVTGMQLEFAFSTDTANALTFMPSAASLLVVFIAGSLADRWGPRRLLLTAITLFIGGAVVVAAAPGMTWVIIGRVLDGIGGVTMAIVALAVVNTAAREPRQRAKVFAVYAAVTPAAFMLAPAVAAFVVQSAGWRAGMLPGIIIGFVALAGVWVYVPRQAGGRPGELLTPLLAGLVLAGLALAVTTLPISPVLAQVAAAVAVLSLLALMVIMRRTANPTLDLGWVRQRGLVIVTIAVAVTAMPNLFFYTNLLLQYRYQVPLIQIALLIMVPQAIAAAACLLSGPVSSKIGPVRASIAALFVSAAASTSTLMVTSGAPIWVPILALSICASPAAFVVGPVTNALLVRAPADASGAASSMRKATWTLGNVLGGAIIGTIAFQAFESKLAGILQADGLDWRQAHVIAREIRDGAVVDELAARVSEPIAQISLIDRGPGLLQAQSYAFWVMGVASAVAYLLAAVLMVAYARRMSAR
ncbi:MAG: MFS transporter [Actinomycetales bacterium]